MCLTVVLLLVCASLSAFIQPAQHDFGSSTLIDLSSTMTGDPSPALHILGYASVTATVVSQEDIVVTAKIDEVLSYMPSEWPDVLLYEEDVIEIVFSWYSGFMNLTNGDRIRVDLRFINTENSLEHAQWTCWDEDYFELIAEASPASININIGAFVAGENSGVDLSENGLPVQGLAFAPVENVENVLLIVCVFENRPENVAEPSETTVLAYLGLTTTASSESISSATVNFAVGRSWLEANGVVENAILLLHWADNEWENLPTTFTGENGTHAFYAAITPGFSVFAITGQAAQPEQPTQPPAAPLWVPIAALVLLVVLLAVIWAHRRTN